MKPPVQVSLNLMPSFYHKHLGLTYGEAYYFDPRYRAGIEKAESRFLHEAFGRYGVGDPDPQPSPMLFIQPIDLIKLTQGARLFCPPDATLEARGNPWEGLTPDEIDRIDPGRAAVHPVMDRVISHYRELRELYGDRADIFGLRAGLMNIHAPYTTAHQLCGQSIFYFLADDPEGAGRIFTKVGDIYRAIFARLAREMGVSPADRIHLGDCSASLLSEEMYRRAVQPINRALAARFHEASYHSCGNSSHLLKAFAALPGLGAIELGAGTDMAAAVAAMPEVEMRPLVDPVIVRSGPTAEVERLVGGLLEATEAAPSVLLCAWSFDRETPIQNVEGLYGVVEEWNRTRT